MLVLMDHSGSIQMAYKASTPEVCGLCKGAIRQGQYYTRHLAPNPWRRNKLIPYNACSTCAPYEQLEQTTGEISLKEIVRRFTAERQETEVMLPVVRVNTPRTGELSNSTEKRPRALRPTRLVREER